MYKLVKQPVKALLINPFTPMILLVILLMLIILVGEFGIESYDNPLTDIFLFTRHLSTWDCVDIVRRNSVLVTAGSERVNPSTPKIWLLILPLS